MSGRCTPARIFTRVDLPAPFSPGERVRLSRVQVEGDVAQRPYGAERLAHPGQCQDRRGLAGGRPERRLSLVPVRSPCHPFHPLKTF
ncbi:hypothetical protein GCM10018952_63250 [Streptosporangium vulgare]